MNKKFINPYFIIITIYCLLTIFSIITYNKFNFSLNSASNSHNQDLFQEIGSIYIDLQYQLMGTAGTYIMLSYMLLTLIYFIYSRIETISNLTIIFIIQLMKLAAFLNILGLGILNHYVNLFNFGIFQDISNHFVHYGIIFAPLFFIIQLYLFKRATNILVLNNISPNLKQNTSHYNNNIKRSIPKNDFFYEKDKFLMPKTSLLNNSNQEKGLFASNEELRNISKALLKHLNDFDVQGKIVNVKQGHLMLIFEFQPNPGIKNTRIISLADDISRVMATSSIRIAHIKNKDVLGIEIPKHKRAIFHIKELIENTLFVNTEHDIPIILGYNIYGNPVIQDLALSPHLLIAGTTGSGKSVGLNTIILSILYNFNPEECKLIMIDPKMLELSIYNDIPHLLTPVITDPAQSLLALKWIIEEMEKRYKLMMKMETRNIKNYNAKISGLMKDQSNVKKSKVQTSFDPKSNTPIYEDMTLVLKKMPYIIVILDEFADLMLTTGKEIEKLIQRIAQKSRAAGIHLIMATQRPSVNVVTGIIKANFPHRISFKVASQIDSRTIIDREGGEKLLGKGDMLFSNSVETTRAHCPFVDENEIAKVVSYLKSQKSPDYIDIHKDMQNKSDEEGRIEEKSNLTSDDLSIYKEAIKLVLKHKKTSISFIQRHLRIGFNKAASIVEEMEKNKILSPQNDKGQRQILINNI